MAKKSKWVQRWEVPSDSRPDTSYVVAMDANGNYACSCPRWKFHRADLPNQECKHIEYVKYGMGTTPIIPTQRPVIQPAQSTTNGSSNGDMDRPKSRTAFIEF